MKIKTYILNIIIFSFIIVNSFAQTTSYTITGTIVDINDGTFIEGAVTTILDLKNDSIIKKVKVGSDGKFKVKFNNGGNFHISFSSPMYETILVPIKYSDFKHNIYIIGNIQLEPLIFSELDEVVVTAKDFKIENKRGKKIFHIGNKLKEVAGTMSNLLSYIPSIFVDIDGKIQLRGKEPIIKINGRRSSLSKADALRMLPSNMVKEIQVIRNPSDREGETEPVINIITDKNQKELIGGVNLAAGLPSILKGGLHLAINKKKFNGYGLYGIEKQNNIKNNTNTFLEILGEDLNYQEKEISNNSINQTNHFGEIQYNYLPNDKSELVGSLSILSNSNKIAYDGLRTVQENAIITNKVDQISDNVTKDFSVIKNIEYEVKLNGEKDFLKAEFEYEYEEKKKNENFSEDPNDQSQNTGTLSNDVYHANGIELNFRYDKVIKNEAYLTLGYRFDRSIINQNQSFESNNWGLPLLKNEIKYSQYDNVGFIDFSDQIKNLYYSFGFQLKNTNRILEGNANEEKSKQNFLNLLPRLYLVYEYGDNSEISFRYMNLLRQPRLSYLNSFNTSTDLQNIRIGNPDLNPQSSHLFELEHFKEFTAATLTTTIYSRFTKDIIQYISTFDNESNRTISRPENIGKATTFGFDISVSLNSPSWLNTIVKLNGEYGILSNDEIDSDDFYSLNTSIVNVIRLNSYRLELSWFYSPSKKINYQMREESNQYFKLGLSKRIFKNKGNLVLSITDPFNTGKKIQKIRSSNFNYINEFNPNQRRISLSLFYRFSTKSKFRKTNKKIKEKGILQ